MISATRIIDNEKKVMGMFSVTPVEADGKFLINPTPKQLGDLGIKGYAPDDYIIPKSDDPESRTPNGGVNLTIWMTFAWKDDEFFVPLRFTLTNDEVQSKASGRKHWINKQMSMTWAYNTDDIAEANAKLPENRKWLTFSLLDQHQPKTLKKGEAHLMIFLTALGMYNPAAKDFTTEYFSDEVWGSFMKGDFSPLESVMRMYQRQLAEIEKPFGISVAVGVTLDEKRRMVIWNKAPGVNNRGDLTPYQHYGKVPAIGSKFDLALRDIKWVNYNADKNFPDGEYSFCNKHQFDYKPTEVKFSGGSLKSVNQNYDEPEVSDDTSDL
jgi:hypothetical protein